jgi:hypothetical protein
VASLAREFLSLVFQRGTACKTNHSLAPRKSQDRHVQTIGGGFAASLIRCLLD